MKLYEISEISETWNDIHISYPQAVYMSKWIWECSDTVSFSPIGERAACKAGPRTKPKSWKSDRKEMWVVLSSGYVALAT